MAVKLILYIVIVLGLILGNRWLNLNLWVNESYLALSLFCAYVVLLFLEIKNIMIKGKGYAEAQRGSFVFSFWIGIIWGVLMSFAARIPNIKNLLDIILLFIGYGVVGCLFGLFGICFLKIFWSQKEEST